MLLGAAVTAQEWSLILTLSVTLGGAIWWAATLAKESKDSAKAVIRLKWRYEDLEYRLTQLELRVHDVDKKGLTHGSRDQGDVQC